MSSLSHTPIGDEWMSVLKIPSEHQGWRFTHWGVRLEDPKKAWLVLGKFLLFVWAARFSVDKQMLIPLQNGVPWQT